MSLKKLLLASASIVVINGAALAADLPSKTKPAPFVAPVFTWSGAYVGVHGGISFIKPNYTEVECAECATNPSVTGGVFGGLAGYNIQSGALVYGVEGDFGFGTHNKTSDTADNNYSKFTMPWNGHLRARLGYAMGQTLFFVAGGAAFAEFKVDDTEVNYGQFRQTRTGWTIGAGVEQAITNNWIVRAEYLYDRFSSKTSNVINSSDNDKSYSASIKPSAHTARVALIYKF